VIGRSAVREVDAQHVGARANDFLEHAGASVAGPSVATILVLRVSNSLRAAWPGMRVICSTLFEHFHGWKRLAFEELENAHQRLKCRRCPPARRISRSLRSCHRHQPLKTRDCAPRLGKDTRAFAELVELEDTDRTVPDDRARALERRGKALGGIGPMSRIMSSAATCATSLTSASADAENSLATTTSYGSGISTPNCFDRSSKVRAVSTMSTS